MAFLEPTAGSGFECWAAHHLFSITTAITSQHKSSVDCNAIMSFAFDFDPANRILRCRFCGRVTDEEVTNYLRIVGQYVTLTLPRGGITDLSEVVSWEVTTETLLAIARRPPGVPPMGRPRVVLTASSHIFGMARTFEREADIRRSNLHVVRTWKEACALLGVEKFHFEPLPIEGTHC
jgi:hypothetical protein